MLIKPCEGNISPNLPKVDKVDCPYLSRPLLHCPASPHPSRKLPHEMAIWRQVLAGGDMWNPVGLMGRLATGGCGGYYWCQP